MEKINYRIQDGCHNCKFCLQDSNYDEETRYYCNIDEKITSKILYLPKNRKQHKIVVAWLDEHGVDGGGICDNYYHLEE